jgi:hypothetical protein
VSADGKKFLINTLAGENAPLVLLVNWMANLKKKSEETMSPAKRTNAACSALYDQFLECASRTLGYSLAAVRGVDRAGYGN